MVQYRELKQRYPDFLLLFRLGDFYELFFDDAERGARLLSITLTSRQGAPMAGIPHHAAESYIARLVQAGQKIAICEQMEAPGKGKKLLRRDVVRVVTPGTVTDTAYLAGGSNNFLLALVRAREGTGVALVDVSTGEFWAGEDAAGEDGVLAAALLRRPSEVVLPDTLRDDERPARAADGRRRDAQLLRSRRVRRAPRGRRALHALRRGQPRAVRPRRAHRRRCRRPRARSRTCGATQGEKLGHLTRLQRLHTGDALALDATAVETLELIDAGGGRARDSLFGVLNETVTPMGARLLRQWLLRPLLDPDAIRARQDAVEALASAPEVRHVLRGLLRRIGDIERLTSRAILGLGHARDLVALRGCLAPLDGVRTACASLSTPLIDAARDEVAPLAEVRALLTDALVDEPPLTLHDGRLIREDWDERLRALIEEAREAREWIAGLEERERTRTGLSSLRVRFNRVFGYGIEVTHAQSARVPEEYVRRQTLTGAERYVTPSCKEYEAKVLGADERRRRLEYELFEDVRRRVAEHAAPLLATARALARLDVFAALGEVAHARGHARPVVDRERTLDDRGRPAPVLEARAEAPVTPNDVALDGRRAHRDPHGAEHGRQVRLPPPDRPHRHHGADGRVRSRARGADRRGRPPVHARRRPGQPEPRPVDVPRGDGGDGDHPQQRHRRAAWCCSTRSAGAPRRSTASRSPGRWWSACMTRPAPRSFSPPTSTS